MNYATSELQVNQQITNKQGKLFTDCLLEANTLKSTEKLTILMLNQDIEKIIDNKDPAKIKYLINKIASTQDATSIYSTIFA